MKKRQSTQTNKVYGNYRVYTVEATGGCNHVIAKTFYKNGVPYAYYSKVNNTKPCWTFWHPSYQGIVTEHPCAF